MVQSRLAARSGVQRVKSIADSFPVRISMWVGVPSFNRHMLVVDRNFSTILPLWLQGSVSSPHMGL